MATLRLARAGTRRSLSRWQGAFFNLRPGLGSQVRTVLLFLAVVLTLTGAVGNASAAPGPALEKGVKALNAAVATGVGPAGEIGAGQHWGEAVPQPQVAEGRGVHTCYVLAGDTPVLVHNTNPASCPSAAGKAGAGREVEPWYPTSNGFLGQTEEVFLQPGQMIDRYGGSGFSKFFSPQGVPAEMRALPPSAANQPLRTFEVLKPFPVQSGRVAPGFGQLGLGTQYMAPVRLDLLLRRGVLREIS